jgi:hypothetical protein
LLVYLRLAIRPRSLSRKRIENRRENNGASAVKLSGRTRTKNAPNSYNKDNLHDKDSNDDDNGRHEDIYDNRRPPTGLQFDEVTGLSGDSSNNDIKGGRKCSRQRIGKTKRREKGNDSPTNRVTEGEGKFVAKKARERACNDQTKKKHSALPDPFLQYQGGNFRRCKNSNKNTGTYRCNHYCAPNSLNPE